MLCPNTMPHDRECEPPHVSESHAGSCASTNQTSTITAVSAIPNSIPSTASRNLPPSECVSGLVTDTITSTEDATSQLPALSQSNSSERQLDSHRTRGVLMPNIITKHHRLRFTVHYTPLLTRYKVTFMNLYQAQILPSTPLPATK